MNSKQDAPKITQHTVAALNNINSIRIDANVTPIYPVRYAYANFFEAELAHAQNPPTISTLLNSNNLKDNDGYLLRILREGWVYIREEDDQENGHFHIFKYEQAKHNNSITEKFTKYLFKNKINAQEGLIVDHSNTNSTYPFVFVRNGIKEISIVYSEHEFHPDVIDKLNGSEDERKECMQRVNLDADSDDYAVPASQENLAKLVEDYRERKNRVLALEESEINPEIQELALDVLTSEISYELEPESVATELQKKIDYGEEARIVALFDPVGRQKEIANAHLKLVLWEKEYASSTAYPYTIGKIVKDFRNTKDEDLKEIVEESINWSAHDEHWGGIEKTFKEFKYRQQKFADLYTSFMISDGHMCIPGSLDTYFRKFFCQSAESEKEANLELQKLCNVSLGVFAGISASLPFNDSLTKIINDAAEKEQEEFSGASAYLVFEEMLLKIITTPQDGINWFEDTKKAIDPLMAYLGPKWGELKALSIYKVRQTNQESIRYSAKATSYVSNKLIPNILKVYGLRVDDNNRVKLTLDQLSEVLSKQISKPSIKFGMDSIEYARLKQKTGQDLIDWAERRKSITIPNLLNKISVPVVMGATNLYNHVIFEKTGQVMGIGLDINFTGLSIYFNVSTIYDFIIQTELSESDPVTKQHQLKEVMRISTTLIALTLDGIQVGRGVHAVSQSGAVAKYLAPNLASKSNLAGKLLSKKLSSRLMVGLNFIGFIVSVWDSVDSYQRDNVGESVGHGIIAIGSAMLFAQACYGVAAASGVIAGGSSWTVLGGLAFGAVSLLTLAIGFGTVLIFGKPRFQLLLEGSLWGVSESPIFLPNDTTDEVIDQRIERSFDIADPEVENSFKCELQEFNNVLYQPQLEIETDHDFSETSLKGLPTRYTYRFTLPGFQYDISNLHVEVHTDLRRNQGRIVSPVNYGLTNKLKEAVKGSEIKYEKGTATLEVYIEMPEMVTLYWYYKPTPDIEIPKRMLDDDGEKQKVLIGMIDSETV